MNPGVTTKFEASTRSAPVGMRTVSAVPTSAMCVPSMTRRAGDSVFAGVSSVPASIATILPLLTADSHISDDSAKVSVRLSQTLFGLLPTTSCRTHQDSYLQFASGCFHEPSSLIGFDSENLFEHLDATLTQLAVGHADSDHPVAVGHSSPDHHGRADH